MCQQINYKKVPTRLCPFKTLLSKTNIRDALRDLVPFVQFKKRDKRQWRSV